MKFSEENVLLPLSQMPGKKQPAHDALLFLQVQLHIFLHEGTFAF